jgi:hypothetical protein
MICVLAAAEKNIKNAVENNITRPAFNFFFPKR